MRRCVLILIGFVTLCAHARQPDEITLLAALQQRQQGQPLWSRLGRPTVQANDFIAVLHAASDYGLQPQDYTPDALAAQYKQLETTRSPQQVAAFDSALSLAALRFLTHLHYGRVDPRTVGFEFHGTRNDLDVPEAVFNIASAQRVPDAVAAAEPGFYHYQLLKAALARYRALAADNSLTQLLSYVTGRNKKSLHEGDAYAGAAALRRLLVALDDLPPTTVTSGNDIYDAALVHGVQHFQDRHGIAPDGVLGARTFAALTTPLMQRVRQIELTLERWRWLPVFTAPPIMVNIPQFRLFIFHTPQDRAADITQMPVIVGQAFPRTRTPVFVGDMRYVIFRPYWDVPLGIAQRELLPLIRQDGSYLQKHDMEIVQGSVDNAKVIPPSLVAYDAVAAGTLRLRQRPGADNALGSIKFIFPNDHNVYLHGTPTLRLFQESRRAFSHGCIRLADPVTLAEHVLKNADGTWDRDHIVAQMNSDAPPLRVNLRQPVRVMIVYGTVLATEAGPVKFFDDIYGHDRKLAALLGLNSIHSAALAR